MATDLRTAAGLEGACGAGVGLLSLEVSGGSGDGGGVVEVGAGLMMTGAGEGGAPDVFLAGGEGSRLCCCNAVKLSAGGGSLFFAAVESAIQEIIDALVFSSVSSLSRLPRFRLAHVEAIWKGPLQSGSRKTVSLLTSVSMMSV